MDRFGLRIGRMARRTQTTDREQRDEAELNYVAAVSGVRCAQGIARPFRPLRSSLTPDTTAKTLAS